MKFSVEVGSLREAVVRAKVTTDATLPIYQGLYLEASLTDNGGKLEVFSAKPGAKSLFTLPASVTEPGSQVIKAAQLLAGLIGQESGALVTLTFSTKLNRLCGICAGSRFSLAVLDGQAQLRSVLRALPVESTDGSIYEAGLLRSVIRRASWCAMRDLSGALTVDALDVKATSEGYKVLATDGYIAVRVDVRTDHPSTDRVLLKESLEAVGKFMNDEPDQQIRIMSSEPIDGIVRETYFRAPGFFHAAAVCDVAMPDIEPIFAQKSFLPQREILVTRSILAAKLHRISGFVERANPTVKLSLRGSVLTLSTASEDGDCIEPLDVVYSDDSKLKESDAVTAVYVSSVFLDKALRSVESEVIVLGLRNAMSPLIVSDEQNAEINTRYVIMTVRGNFEALDEDAEAVVLNQDLDGVNVVDDRAAGPDENSYGMNTPAAVDDSFLDDDEEADIEDTETATDINEVDDEEDIMEMFSDAPEVANDGSSSDALPVGAV